MRSSWLLRVAGQEGSCTLPSSMATGQGAEVLGMYFQQGNGALRALSSCSSGNVPCGCRLYPIPCRTWAVQPSPGACSILSCVYHHTYVSCQPVPAW